MNDFLRLLANGLITNSGAVVGSELFLFLSQNHKMSLSKLISTYYKDTSDDVFVYTFDSPIGKIIGAADNNFLYMVSFEDSKNIEKVLKTISEETSCKFVENKNEILKTLGNELEHYFFGKLQKFSVPVRTLGSNFQKRVWQKLQELPYGSTQTYGDLAKAMGQAPSHSRAVGAACGANAHIIIIPCHRLVASGSKGGFSSGVDRKEWLINHEKEHAHRFT